MTQRMVNPGECGSEGDVYTAKSEGFLANLTHRRPQVTLGYRVNALPSRAMAPGREMASAGQSGTGAIAPVSMLIMVD